MLTSGCAPRLTLLRVVSLACFWVWDTDIIPQPELLWGMGDGFVIVLVLVVPVVAFDVRVKML